MVKISKKFYDKLLDECIKLQKENKLLQEKIKISESIEKLYAKKIHELQIQNQTLKTKVDSIKLFKEHKEHELKYKTKKVLDVVA